MRLVMGYPHRWGPGKMHIAVHQSGTRSDATLCNLGGVHGDVKVDGDIDIVTCSKCRAAYWSAR